MIDKRYLGFLLLLSFITAPVFIAIPHVRATSTTYYVSTAGNDGDTGLSFEHAWQHIQYAVDNFIVVTGDAILVAAGTYDEQVVITKSITLEGTGDTTTIQPSGPLILADVYTYPAGFTYYSGVTISGIVTVKNTVGAGVTIKNLKVDGASVTSLPAGAARLAGILYGESAGKIQNVTVNNIKTTSYADRTYGIDLSAAVNTVSVEVSNCRITDFARNGVMGNGPLLTVNIHGNNITGPPAAIGPEQVPNGIVFMAELGGNASGNTIHSLHYNVPLSWESTGIMGFDTLQPGVVFENNEIYDVDDAINPSSGTIIKNNNLHNNVNGVVLEMGATDNQIVNNDIKNNANGIQINGALNPNPEGQEPPGTGNFAHFNNIVGNAVGLYSYDPTKALDARFNWWGSPTGPNTQGGEPVIGNADVSAYLQSPFTTRLYTSPDPVVKIYTEIGTDFTVDVKVEEIEDFLGFDIELTWDNTLITLVDLDDTPLNVVWPQGFAVVSPSGSGPGYFRYVAVAEGGNSYTGSGTLLTLRFHVEEVSDFVQLHTSIHFEITKLSNSFSTPIPAAVDDGLYQISSIRGDVDCDGKVDVFDLRTIATCYDQSTPTKYDLNNDGTIDIFDLVVVATNFD